IGRKELEPLRLAVTAEHAERRHERLGPKDACLGFVEHTKARVEAGGERVRAKQARAEAMNRRDPRPIDLSGKVTPVEVSEAFANSLLQFPGRSVGVRDDEDGRSEEHTSELQSRLH